MKNTIIWLLVAVVVVGGGYWYWQSRQATAPMASNIPSAPVTQMEDGVGADAMAGWKTYTDAKYGFEFKYPKDFSLLTNYADVAIQRGDVTFGININRPTGFSGWESYKTSEDITIDGFKTKLGFLSHEDGRNYLQLVQGENGYLFSLRFVNMEDREVASGELMRAILSTFKLPSP
jgi:hypothetical protein